MYIVYYNEVTYYAGTLICFTFLVRFCTQILNTLTVYILFDYIIPLYVHVHIQSIFLVIFSVKPENLLIDIRTATTASIKLVDFGDARHIYNHYYIHTFNGNPEFMPPEIVGGTPVSLLSDIW